jgi:hypothetical protein
VSETNYDLGFREGIEMACRVALTLEEKWRNTATRHRASRQRWFFGWYIDPVADRDARSIEAAADGIKAIRTVLAERIPAAPKQPGDK